MQGFTKGVATDVAPPARTTAATPVARRRRLDPVLVTTTVIALVPIATAVVRAITSEWVPIGDHAYFAIRARDVFTADPPLLGTWTSASLTTGAELNNPGPLLFDVLAPPVRLFGAGTGLVVGVGLLNAGSLIGAVAIAARQGGRLLGMAAAAGAAVLCWTMGSQLLFDPWQPHCLLLPFFFFLMLVWATSTGDLVALPFLAAVGSLILQSHLSYGYLLVILTVWALVGLGRSLRRSRAAAPAQWSQLRRHLRTVAVLTAVVLALCWVQPLIEQLGSSSGGNLTQLASVLQDSDSRTTGPGLGVQLVATVVGTPPWWLRPSFGDAYLPPSSVPSVGFVQTGAADVASLPSSLLVLGLIGASLIAIWWLARRAGDHVGGRAATTAVVALVAAVVTAARMPLGAFGIAPHQFRWLWPLAAFLTFVAVVVLARRVDRPRLAVGLLGGLTVAFAAMNLPSENVRVGPAADDWAITPTREVGQQMEALGGSEPLLFDVRGTRFADPYTAAMMAQLQDHGVDFVVDDDTEIRQLGPARRWSGDNARAVLYVRSGDAADSSPPGAERVVLRPGLDGAERQELASLRRSLSAYLDGVGVPPLNERGRRALAEGELEVAQQVLDGAARPEALLSSRQLVLLSTADMIDEGGGVPDEIRRYAELQRTWDRGRVALFVGRIEDRP